MKYTVSLLLFFTCFVWIGCDHSHSNQSTSTFTTISGTIENGGGQKLFLNRINSKQRGEIIDTITIGADNTFNHTVKTPLKLDYYVLSNKRNQVYLITDSTENIVFNADYKKLQSPTKVSGSQHTEVYRSIFDQVSAHAKELDGFDNQIISAKTTEDKKTIAQLKNQSKVTFRNSIKEFIQSNQDSPGIAGFFDAMDFSKEPEISSMVINNLAKTVPYTNYYKARETHVKAYANPNQKKTVRPDVGKVAPPIKLDDPNGKERTLYELRGNVVLVDFWASWCGPCRKENPNVVKAYKKYHDDGFEVLSVSLDSDKSRWVKAIDDDGLIWDTHVSDLLKWKTPYKTSYNFSGIPHAVLVDREGTIIQSKIRGPELEETLESIFGY